MRTKLLLFTILALALLAACHSDDLVVDNADASAQGGAFITVDIALANSYSPATRAGQGEPNDQQNDGPATEWAVKDFTIVVLDGDTDAAKIIMLKSIIVDTEWPQNPLANFTFSKEYTIETKIELPKCYVLAIANYKGQFALEVGKTSYSDIKNALIGRSKEGFWTSKGNEIFMINSPMLVLTDKDPVGGEEAITHLQILAPCSPKPTAEESAKATNRAKIFLERILGKVEVTTPRDGNPNKPYWSGWTYTVPTEGGTNGDKVTFISWGLDVTNTTTYPIRRIEEEWIGYPSFTGMGTSSNVDQSGTQAFAKNRFIGEYKYDERVQRIYWAIDPNYDTPSISDFSRISSFVDLNTPGEGANVDYCLENTFDVKNQKQDRTTRVVMKAKYKFKGQLDTDNPDFYRSSLDVVFTYNNLCKYIAGVMGLDPTSVTAFTIDKDVSSKEAMITSITYNDPSFSVDPIQITGLDAENNLLVAGATYTESFANYRNEIGPLDYYKDGECYYVARILHFGDKLTPWVDGYDYTGGSGENDTKDYLGRYGIVRNNWYVLTINKVDKGPGEPVVPDPPDKPDDESFYYIETEVHIRSWTVRNQTAEW